MRDGVIKSASSAIVGLGIFVVFIVYLTRCAALSNWSDLSRLESLILVTQIVRVSTVIGLGRFHRIQPQFVMILFSLEVFMIPAIGLYTILSGDNSYTVWMAPVLTTWIGVSSIVLSPYSIYELARGMMKKVSLIGVMVIASLEADFMLFLARILTITHTTIQGPSALGTLLIRLGVSQLSSAGLTGISSFGALSLGLALFYVGMITYVTLGDHKLGSPVKISYALLFPLVGTMMVLAWTFVSLSISSDVLLIFTIPTLVGITALWGSSRGS